MKYIEFSGMFRLDRGAIFIILLYLVLCVLLALVGDPSCITFGGECARASDRYSHQLASMLFDHGQFVVSHGASGPYVEHPPLHALILAGTFFLVGYKTYLPIYIFHVLLNILTGLLVRIVTLQLIGRYGTIALAVFLLNPNVYTVRLSI